MFRISAILLGLAVARCAATVPANSTSRKLALIGDWGGQGTPPFYNPPEMATALGPLVPEASAEALARYSRDNPLSAALLLGDNFYPAGISGDAHSLRFEATFESVFNGSSLEDIPFYAVLGNHDYKGNVTAEVAYTALSDRWDMPSTYYSKELSFKGSDGAAFSAHLIAIDTVMLAGMTTGEDPTQQPPGPADATAATSQWDWIEAQLAGSTADFVFVFGHYPVISGCSHGPTLILDALLQPMLEKYGAHYLSGHDHCQEYSEYKGVSYILSGVGHGCCYEWTNEGKNPAGSIKWHHAADTKAAIAGDVPDAGFAVLDLDTDGFAVTYFNADLDTQYVSPKVAPRSAELLAAK